MAWVLALVVVFSLSVFSLIHYSRVDQQEILMGHVVIPWTTVTFTPPEDVPITNAFVGPGDFVQEGQIIAKYDVEHIATRLTTLREDVAARQFLVSCLTDQSTPETLDILSNRLQDIIAQYTEDCAATRITVQGETTHLSQDKTQLEAALHRLETRFRATLTNRAKPPEMRLREALILKRDRDALLTQRKALDRLLQLSHQQSIKETALFQSAKSQIAALEKELDELTSLQSDPHFRSNANALILTEYTPAPQDGDRPRPMTGLLTTGFQTLSRVTTRMPLSQHVPLTPGHRVTLSFHNTATDLASATGTIQNIDPLGSEAQRIEVQLDQPIHDFPIWIKNLKLTQKDLLSGAIQVSLTPNNMSTVLRLPQRSLLPRAAP